MKKNCSYSIILTILTMLIINSSTLPSAVAEVSLPKIFGSHMVLQQEQPITIWGWANPNEKITVQLSSQTQEVQANEKGEWKAILPALKAGGPHTLTVKGSNIITFEDVLVGEVWLCSGQSNMEMGMTIIQNGQQETAAANYPDIRLLMVANRWTPEPQKDIEGTWKACTPESAAEGGWGGFSACAYFFGRELHKTLKVPIGLIDATWGGTRIESWTPPEGFAAVPTFKNDLNLILMGNPGSSVHKQRLEHLFRQTEEWISATKTAMSKDLLESPMPAYPPELVFPRDLQNPTALYNGMIHPLCPFVLRGAIWYQGESNNGEGMLYAERMKALIGGWRSIWSAKNGEYPFYFVQIAPFQYGIYNMPSQTEQELWEAQAAVAREIPGTGMAVINDIGNIKDIHPVNKQDVGKRLAMMALAKTYGKKDIVYSGPVFKDMKIEDNKLRISFDHTGSGLASRDGKPLDWFEIADTDDGWFVKADAVIDGETVVLSAAGVNKPVAMRFAWDETAVPNLMNKDGLPAGSFRAGTIPQRDWMSANVPEAKNFTLVYDLDLAKLAHDIKYDTDNHTSISKPFDRIAYSLELQGGTGSMQCVYVSMDAFTQDPAKIGIPSAKSGSFFQQSITNMNVFSNVKGITTGIGLASGNIELWPHNYAQLNTANVPNASGQIYDCGDQPVEPLDGYGSMQIHNNEAKQTLLAINHWPAGVNADIGIGNRASDNTDWAFAGNAQSFKLKRLRVLVHCK